MIPNPIKVGTATKDLMLSQGSPQIPCPEVQPFPSFVPNPTKNPPRIHPIICSSDAPFGSNKVS